MPATSDVARAVRLSYGGVPVPYTASWSSEAAVRVDACRFSRGRALCNDVSPGQGKPRFGKPHFQRQREAIVLELCDLCGRSLRNRTKVSLSHARPCHHAAQGTAILQVEPLLHRECAALSMAHCPSLKADLARGTVRIRQVTRSRAQVAIADPAHLDEYVPDYRATGFDRIAAHAKVELLGWIDRDVDWLVSAIPSDAPDQTEAGR